MHLLPAPLFPKAGYCYFTRSLARKQRSFSEKITERGKMSFCITLWMVLSRNIHALAKKKKNTKHQQKREQQRFFERFHESARFQPSTQSGQEYQHLDGHEHPGEEGLRDSNQGHPSPLQTFDWLDTEVVDPSEDKLPTYDDKAARLPPYDHGSFPHRRRQREGSHGDVRNGAQINERFNEPGGRGACTGMRIMDHPDVNHGGAVIWYDALEDRYEVISRSLAPPTEPPLPPPYMPNRREVFLHRSPR